MNTVDCGFCKKKPHVVDNVLYHKCKKMSLMISDSDTIEIPIQKWNTIQKDGSTRNVILYV